jgi:hypothetical protein
MSNEHERYGPLPTPESPQEPQPAPSAPGQRPQMDLHAARFYAGRGPGGAALRRNRPAYSLGALDNDCPWSVF